MKITINKEISGMEEGINYEIFKQAFKLFKKEKENDETLRNFINNIDDKIKLAKIFFIDDKQKNFFVMGKVKVQKYMDIKLPFDMMFFDVSFTKEELKEYGIKIKSDQLIGILISKGYVYYAKDKDIKKDDKSKSAGENIRLTLLTRTGGYFNFETYSRNINFYNDFDNMRLFEDIKSQDKKAQHFWYKFFLNIIKFINFPNVVLKEHKRTEANIKRRIKKGKVTIPEYIVVKLDGQMQKYIDDIYDKPRASWHYNYAFDVKGHYRHLASPRYKEAKEIWIEPFVKGTGKKVETIYKIQKKKK